MVIALALLVSPTRTLPNGISAGDTVPANGGALPVPLRVTGSVDLPSSRSNTTVQLSW